MHFLFDLDHWQELRASLVRNRMRTFLTAFGVFWGIFLLMIMLASGAGLRNGATQGFAGSATNSFFIWTQLTQKAYAGFAAGRSLQLSNADVLAIRDKVPEVELVLPRNQVGGYGGGVNVTRGRRAAAFSVMGDYPEIQRIQTQRVESGRFLNALDIEERRKVAVIGTRVRELLFGGNERVLGESLVISGVYFQVVGVLSSQQAGAEADREAQTIFIPFTTSQRVFNYGEGVGWLAVISRADVRASLAEERTLALLRSLHQVAPDDLRAFGHFNTEVAFEKVQNLFRGIRSLVWLVGLGTLAAGVIGVSNIMLIIVRERTKEIGIRRALGATPLAVVLQIVSEAVLLTALAGYLGLVGGIALVVLVGRLPGSAAVGMFLNPDIGLGDAFQALAILVAAGVVAGLAPAQRALAMRPTVALRSE